MAKVKVSKTQRAAWAVQQQQIDAPLTVSERLTRVIKAIMFDTDDVVTRETVYLVRAARHAELLRTR